jgi:hypothetical protein
MNPLKIFQKPSPATLAKAELEEAQRQLLDAQSAKEYAISMCAYHEARIHRLNKILSSVTSKSSDEH